MKKNLRVKNKRLKTRLAAADKLLAAGGRENVIGSEVDVCDVTALKQAEEALRTSEQMWQAVVKHIPACVALVRGTDLRLQLVNPAYQALAPGKAMVGKTLNELWPETGQDLNTICRRVLETGEPHQVVDELNTVRRMPDGPVEWAYFSWSLRRVRLPGEEGWGLLNTAWETTSRKRAELQLRDVAEKFSTLFDATLDGVCIHNLKGEILEVNDSYCRMSGYSRQELENMSVSKLEANEPPKEVAARMRRLIKKGGHDRFESRHRRKDGTIFDVDVTALHLEREGGRIAIFARDITGRKQAERLNQSLNTINDLIHSTLDRDKIMQRVVEEAARTLGCDSAAISLRLGGGWKVAHVYGFPAEVVGTQMTDSEERHAVLAVDSGKPVAIKDAFSDKRVDRRHMKKWGIRSVLVVPLAAAAVSPGEAEKGAMLLNYHNGIRDLGEAHLDFAEKLSVSLSLAIENARLFRELNLELVERKRAEDKLVKQWEELQTILDSSPAMIFYKDTENRFLRVNRAMEKAMGLEREQLEGKSLFDVFPRDQALAFWNDDLEVLKSGNAKRRIVETVLTAEGSRLVETDKIPYVDDAGSIIGVIGFSIDVTERKRAEEALLKSRMDLERAQTVGSIGSWRLDILRNELVWSDETYRIFDVQKGLPLSYESFVAAVHPDDRDYVDRRWKAAMAGEDYDIEHRIIAEGKVKWVRERAYLEFDENGGLIAGFGIAQDITVRKQAEEILRRDKETFEKLVEKRTAELVDTQMELERAKRLSDIGVLAATVAHELRNPLAAILLAAHNVRRKTTDPNLGSHLATIDKKVAESDQIISNLLFFSRIKPPLYQRVDLFNILEESIEAIEDARGKDILTVREIDSLQTAHIEADPTQIKEVFNNILANAYDAVPADGGEIAVVSDIDDGFVTISFEDNGPGIANDVIDRVFDPFFTTKARGTGLGLSVSKQIVTMHEGEIGVRPGASKGTCVYVRLPKRGVSGDKENPDNRR